MESLVSTLAIVGVLVVAGIAIAYLMRKVVLNPKNRKFFSIFDTD